MIYPDHNATTPVLPEVLGAMLPYFASEWGNPSSSYRFGSGIKAVIETAREQVADLIGAQPREIIFTGCAPESNNAAIQRTLRGGTETVPLIVGMGKAAELSRKHLPDYEKKVRPLREALEEEILISIPNNELNGHKRQRLANTTNITFHGIESEALLILLDQEGICASSGSACLADSDESSHVVKAMRTESAASRQMIRLSLGMTTTRKDGDAALAAIRKAVNVLRE